MTPKSLQALVQRLAPSSKTDWLPADVGGLVTGVRIQKSGRLICDCLVEKPLAADLLCRLEASLEEALSVREVLICQRLSQPLPPEDSHTQAAQLMPWLLRHLEKRDILTASMLKRASFAAASDQVCIEMDAACCALLEDEKIVELVRFFERHADLKTDFSLAPAAGSLSAYTQKLEKRQRQKAKKLHASQREAAPPPTPPPPPPTTTPAARPYRRSKKTADTIWGRMNPQLEPSRLEDLHSESGNVLLQGKVIDFDRRPVSQNTRVLLKFALHDATSTVSCILFVKPEEADSLASQIDGNHLKVCAQMSFDSQFAKDLQARVTGVEKAKAPPPRRDDHPQKRVELHAHTKMSTRDAVSDTGRMIRQAASFGHPAIAITDHGVVQAFPEAAETRKALQKEGQAIKIIYGLEGYLVDDGKAPLWQVQDCDIEDGFVALDVETTGLDAKNDRLIEVAAVRFRRDESGTFRPVESKVSLVNPGIPVPPRSQEITGITTEQLAGKPDPFTFLGELTEFIGQDPVVAHNAFFDLDFLRYEGFRTPQENDPRHHFNPPLIDTLGLARAFLPDLKNHRLNTVCEHLQVDLSQHHRADADAAACGEIFARLYEKSGANSLQELAQSLGRLPDEACREHRRAVHHIVLLAQDEVGLYNLYRLVSASHTRFFHSRPRIPRSLLQFFRAGLIVGSACESGELFQAVEAHYREHGCDFAAASQSLGQKSLLQTARFYDYLEIQPLDNNRFMVRDPQSEYQGDEALQDLNRLVVQLAEKTKRPACATCDVHFIEPEESILRQILMTDMGFSDAKEQADLHLRTSDEMLREFAYLGPQVAQQVVVQNPARIAARVKDGLQPFPDGSFPPIIETAAAEVRRLTLETAHAIYGKDGKLPAIVEERMEHELSSIIDNGYAIMYYISHKLVKKSNDDGYIVGSRGSVGSSLVAAFCGISEVNPLAPHHVCPDCHVSCFDESGTYGSGYDLPPADCPECGAAMLREGQDIPFETFLGFEGDKQPDIDLNFSGQYQPVAHRFIEDMFGKEHTYRAGTISGYAEKNAQAIVRSYFQESETFATQAEIGRLARGLIGVKRTTGQHPGGIVVVPKEREIYDFTPVQHPADKRDGGTVTTHFDFNAMHETILKLDILGHDDPTMLKMLSDLTGVDVLEIPIPEPKVMSLFQSAEALGIDENKAPDQAATLGLPEMGTFMARDMIRETRPSRFFDLVQLMGLSHGTDVWKGNAQELIRSGTCTINEVIGCRDSIMTGLIYKGLPPKEAFTITEKVRKGRGMSPEQEQLMRDHGVPEWYIDSCRKIRYMFPKAHAAAYTISALRVAYFKVYHAAEYYCAFFTVRADEFDSSRMCLPPLAVSKSRKAMRRQFRELSDREQKIYYILELVEEMQLRGIDFLPIDLMTSEASVFCKIDDQTILPPLDVIPAVSTAIAENIVRARKAGPFKSKDELMRRSGIGRAAIEALETAGCLKGMPESAQMDLEEWLS